MATPDTRNCDFDEDWDFTEPGEYERATKYYVGPFCGCGDFSCPAMRDEHVLCHYTHDNLYGRTSPYPEHWTDEDIEAYELGALLDNVHFNNRLDIECAAAQLA